VEEKEDESEKDKGPDDSVGDDFPGGQVLKKLPVEGEEPPESIGPNGEENAFFHGYSLNRFK